MAIKTFNGEYRFLSNFYPCTVTFEGETYTSTEHAYQAAKTLDPVNRKLVRESESPGLAKRLGTRVPLRADWEEVKLGVMESLLRQKFAPGTALRERLDATQGQKLTEGNWWCDNMYGSCSCNKCGDKGRNELGKMLMRIRDNG